MLKARLAQLAQQLRQRTQEKGWQGTGQSVALGALHLINGACAIHLFAEHVGWICTVDGPSMLPTMSLTGEWVIENRMVDPHRLTRGDLVTFLSPLDPGRIVCKRVIGLPGDVICVDPTGELAPSTEHVVIPRNHVWVSGDNAALSRDSRLYGPVSMGLVRGRLVARIWPLRNFTIFQNNFNYID
ncbi:LexA/Signal peptidase [Laetiporus sulphureus 93-53]|uniref:LexA/Signal peptidase n=1 Tax=Laetiporus sulphureus 93-53 TaxID=1314785 RepID=A0A165DZ19_9APHY|nr:LexA/Signal peptidase [Laetiporus sulphureus 93-53]KZT05925.1 LexA/Signal peptidase [Laetiporus sulphureus 93-53]